MDAAEIARQAAYRLHKDAVAAGRDPTRPLEFAKAEADRRSIDVYVVAPDHPGLKGGKACYDHQAGHILVASDGTDFERALLIGHEIGHVELEGPTADNVVMTLDAARASEAQSAAERIVDYSHRERREVRMDLFAREFLLPRPVLKALYLDQNLSRQDISARFGAPLDLVTQQLLDALLLPAAVSQPPSETKAEKALDLSQQGAADQRGPAFQLQAGPGTGKTQTLIHHIDGLLREGAAPDTILALTFSNKAAAELIERLQPKHPQSAAGIWAGTFHSFGFDIIRRFHDRLGLPASPRLIDRSEAIELLEDELARLPLRHFRNLWDPTLILADILAGISRAKDEVANAARYRAHADTMLAKAGTDQEARERAEKCVEVAQVYEVYEKLMLERGMVDFGDLVAMPVRLVETDADATSLLAARHRHIIVDEYQDVNRASVRLLQQLRQPGNRIWVVGDARQSIYRFRGASSANMARFATDFTDAKAAPLAVNYRSTDEVVATFQVFAGRMEASRSALPINLKAERGKGSFRPLLRIAGTPEHEIGVVAAAIEDAKAGDYAYRDQAILCSSNARLAEFAAGLEVRGIPVLYLGSIFQRPEVKSLLSLLSLLQDRYAPALISAAGLPSSQMSLADVQTITAHLRSFDASPLDWRSTAAATPELSKEGQQAVTALAESLAAFNATSHPWHVLAALILDNPAIAKSLAAATRVSSQMQAIAIWQLLSFAQNQPPAKGAPIRRLLDRIRRLLLIADDRELRQLPPAAQSIDAVHLMTIHGSKGLEFPIVHLPDLIVTKMPRPNRPPRCPPPDGIIDGTEGISSLQALQQGHEQEQECVFFVALSRARDQLHLSASSQQANGNRRNRSSFLDCLAPHLTEITAPRAIDGPVAHHANVPVTWRTAPCLTDQQLALYDRCPRRFFYTHVMKLGGRRSETPFTQMHDALQSVLDWIATEHPASHPAQHVVEAQLNAAWQSNGPADHPFVADYRRIAGELVSYLLASRQSHDLVAPKPLTLTVGDSQITVIPNHVVRKSDGSIAVRKVKTGRPTSDEFTGLDYTVMLLAARDAYGPATLVEAVHLTSGTVSPADISARSLASRRSKAEGALAAIRIGAFKPDPDERSCPRCPHLFVCGALPAGKISAEI